VIGEDPLGLLVATGGGVLRVRRLQRPGGRMLGAPEFLRGFPDRRRDGAALAADAGLVSASPFRR
jgi:methionyl-tRNA formyltransferase